MGNRFNWNLEVWGDGTIRLVQWDSMHGEDIILVLNDDGTASQTITAYKDDDDEMGTELRRPVELVPLLRQWAIDQKAKGAT